MKITEHNYTTTETDHNEWTVKGEMIISEVIYINYVMKYDSYPNPQPSGEELYDTVATLIEFTAHTFDSVDGIKDGITLLIHKEVLEYLLENEIKL